MAGSYRLASATVFLHSLVDTLAQGGSGVSFDDYVKEHGRAYGPGSEEYEARLALFRTRTAEIERHNSAPNRTWKATINHLTDRTDKELRSLRGYRRSGGSDSSGSAASPRGVAFMGKAARVVDMSHLPTGWTWVGRLQAMEDVRDQGECGSCWAFATATVLRAHSELYQEDRTFSVQQLVSCTPNPNSCGGSGGCQGATAELAMDYVSKVGLSSEDEMLYRGKDTSCPQQLQAPKPSFVSALRDALRMPSSKRGGSALGMSGWRKLPENKPEPLLLAVYEEGPVAVSLQADEKWNHYGGGVLDSCSKEAVVNHAVVLVGYGVDQDLGGIKYWQIQNSWGNSWGEEGHVRLQRRDSHEEAEYCGWDTQPELGTGCKGGPEKVYVCGSCGVLYDSAVPQFVHSDHGWVARQRVMLAQLNATLRRGIAPHLALS